DICEGDSGSPLMFRINNHWIVVGITSTSPPILDDRIGLCDPFDPAIFTRVSNYLNWIYSKMNL
ncbi:proclotting enzyme-like protein, partial [Dinothrombium tinctorium]